MPRVLAFPIFVLVEIILLPFTLIGGFWYLFGLCRARKKLKISLTAYKIVFQRFLLHYLGYRSDQACARLMPSLPGCSSLQLALLLGPSLLAAKLSGLRPTSFEYPVVQPSSYGTFISHRTKFFDDALLQHLGTVEQIVILGAGWDTRAYQLLLNFSGPIFEVDRPGMQQAKRVALKSAGLESAHVTFVEVDFRQDSWMDKLVENGFCLSRTSFFLWEGVVYYLEPLHVHQTLEQISKRCAPGSFLAFDYPSSKLLSSTDPWVKYALDTLQFLGEAWHFGISTEPPPESEIRAFLGAFGLETSGFEPFGPAHCCFGGVVLARTQGSQEQQS